MTHGASLLPAVVLSLGGLSESARRRRRRQGGNHPVPSVALGDAINLL